LADIRDGQSLFSSGPNRLGKEVELSEELKRRIRQPPVAAPAFHPYCFRLGKSPYADAVQPDEMIVVKVKDLCSNGKDTEQSGCS